MKHSDPFFVKRDIRDNLLASYSLGDTIGAVIDETPNSNNGVITGAVRTPDSLLGNRHVLSFDGVDDIITFGDIDSFNLRGDYSISCLVKVGSVTSYQRILSSPVGFGFGQYPDGIVFTTWDRQDYLMPYVFEIGKFYDFYCHISNSYDVSFYINTVYIGTIPSLSTPIVASGSLYAGCRPPHDEVSSTEFFKGSIDYIRIYNGKLSQDNLNTLYRFFTKKYGLLPNSLL